MTGLFFPQRVVLKIDQREYTPTVIDQIVFAGGSHRSAQKAARGLLKLARLKFSAMQVLRITEQIGNELLAQREHDAALQQHRELKSTNETPVEIACVEVDGGRMQTRASEQGRCVHNRSWKETKVAALWKMAGPTFETDPHPDPPHCFLDPDHVSQMVREIKQQRSESHERDESPEKTSSQPQLDADHEPQDEASLDTPTLERQWPPQR